MNIKIIKGTLFLEFRRLGTWWSLENKGVNYFSTPKKDQIHHWREIEEEAHRKSFVFQSLLSFIYVYIEYLVSCLLNEDD